MVVYSLVCDETRLFSSSSGGEVKEWDPATSEFRQMTILSVSEICYISEQASDSLKMGANKCFSHYQDIFR